MSYPGSPGVDEENLLNASLLVDVPKSQGSPGWISREVSYARTYSTATLATSSRGKALMMLMPRSGRARV